jgi:type VI secretion system secreted protein VgrG
MAKATQQHRDLAVSTPLGEDQLLLASFRGEEAISRLFQFRLEMLSDDPAIKPQDIVGQNVTFRVNCRNGNVRYFNGHVSRFAAGAMTPSGDYRKYRAEVVPWLWFLGRTTDCRIFQNKKVPDIIQQIFQDLGFKDFSLSGLQGSYPERVYCVQYRETDLNFVCRLMEEEGIFYYFRHENGKHTLVLSDATTGYGWCAEKEAHYEATRSTHPDEDRILAWEHVYEFRSGRLAHTDYNFETPSTQLMATESGRVSLPNNKSFELYDYPGEYEDTGDGRRLARVRIEEEEAPFDTVEAESTCRTFSAGHKFTYKDYQLSAESGQTRVITQVLHEAVEPNAYETIAESERDIRNAPIYRNTLTCIPESVCFRPPRVTRKAVVQGVQTAVIVGPQGEEIYPDEYGRVKVQFHWDREGKRDENSSCWIRVSQMHAGQGWGYMDLPRIGEEVIVDFLEGDPDRPIITGRVYNAEQMPPFKLPDQKTRRGNSTKTHKGAGFNEMSMDDTQGQEQLRIHAQYNMDSVVENDETHTVHNNRTKAVDVDETMTIGNNQKLDVGVNKSVKVGTNHDETVGVNQTVNVGTNQSTTVGTNQSNSVGMMKNETVGIMSNEMVGAVKTTSVGAAYALTVGAVMNTAVGFISAEEVGMKKFTVVGSDYKVTAGSKFEISCGGSSIKMDSGGNITIEASSQIVLKGGGATIVMKGGIIDLN